MGAWRLVPDLFLFSKETLYEVKVSDQHLTFTVYLVVPDFDVQKKQQQQKSKGHQILDCLFRSSVIINAFIAVFVF